MSIFWMVNNKGQHAKAKTETRKEALAANKGYSIVRTTSTCEGAKSL